MPTPASAVSGILWPGLPRTNEAKILSVLFQLEQSQWWTPKQHWRQQRRQLAGLVAHAVRTAPFYKKRLGPVARLKPEALMLERWRRVPIIRRPELQEAGNDVFSLSPPRDHRPYYTDRTSGSMGRPLNIRGTAVNRIFRSAMNLRGHYWHHRDLTAKMASIRRLGDAPGAADGIKRMGTWVAAHKGGPSIVRDIAGSLSDHLAWLNKEKPAYFVTYPTFALALARHALRHGIEFPRLRELSAMGEVVDSSYREWFEKNLGIRVVDLYSAHETNVIALQCPDNAHYHVQSEFVFVEILDDNGKPCPPGEIGRVVVTGLHNFAMPLIRYEIGDYAEVGETCSCGRTLPVLKRILGRARNMVTLPSGEQVWARISGGTLMEVAPIRQIQLVQRQLDEIEVKLVAPGGLNPNQGADLGHALAVMLGHSFALKFLYVVDIPRSTGGKFEDFLSELSPP